MSKQAQRKVRTGKQNKNRERWAYRCPACGTRIVADCKAVRAVLAERLARQPSAVVAIPCGNCASAGVQRALLFGWCGFVGGWQEQGWGLADVLPNKPENPRDLSPALRGESKFRIDQELGEGFDPDEIAKRFSADMNKLS